MPAATFRKCLEAKDSSDLAQELCSTLKALPSGTLPLEAGRSQGGMVDDRDIAATVLGMEQTADHLLARVGVFFTEVVGGCNCNEEPIEVNAYCLLEVRIDRATGNGQFTVATG
jgi:hypothetical protein